MTTYLITGGAGSLGKEIVREIDARVGKIREAGDTDLPKRWTQDAVRVIDINEADLAMLKFPTRRIYGDICDLDRIDFAMRGVDVCIHAAALKNLEIAEYNIDALLRTNIQGTLAVARAAMKRRVKHAILVSSDKAVLPTTAYGASKAMGEKIWLWANRIQRYTTFIILRSGNFYESRGNVLEIWKKQAEKGEPLTITSPEMKRYFIRTDKVARIILDLPGNVSGGEIVIPWMEEHNIELLARYLYPNAKTTRIPIRPGEKMVEEIVNPHERVVRTTDNYTVVE